MKNLIIFLILMWVILLGLIVFTDVFDSKYKYIRLRSGQEFRGARARFINHNSGIIINGTEHKYLDVDSISPE